MNKLHAYPNNNLSKRLLVGDNIASADLLNDIPDERFGTLSMRFSDGTINQLLLLDKTRTRRLFRSSEIINGQNNIGLQQRQCYLITFLNKELNLLNNI